jgi:O-antigen/teichoic acid export membrane protein
MTGTSVGRLIDNVGALVLRQASTWSLTFVLILYLPRYLGDSGFGMVTFATALIPLLLVVTNLGVGTYLVKRIAVESEHWSDLFWNAIALRLMGTLLVLLFMLPVIRVFFEGDLRGLLLLTAVTLAVLSLVRTQEYAIQGLEKMRWLAFAEIANKGIVAAVGIALLVSGYGVVTFGAVVLLGAIAQLLVNMLPLVSFGLRRPTLRFSEAKALLLGGLPFFFAGAITNLYTLLDVATLQALVTQEVVGWYGAAMQLYATLNFFPLILSTAMLPLMSRLYAERSPQFIPMAARASAYTLMLSLPVGVGLAVSSHALIGLLGYPEAFDNSVPVLIILSLTLIPAGQLMMLYMVVTAMDRQREWVRLIAVALAIGLVLNVVLIPITQHFWGNGGIGAAIATLAAEAAQLGLAVRLMPEGLHNRTLALQSAQAVGAVVVMAVVVVGLQVLLGAPILVFVPVGAATYGIALLVTGAVSVADLRRLSQDWLSSRSVSSRIDSATAVAITE